MKQELFKIEQYADLALRYIKLEDIASDLVIECCELGSVVHECVKKIRPAHRVQTAVCHYRTNSSEFACDAAAFPSYWNRRCPTP